MKWFVMLVAMTACASAASFDERWPGYQEPAVVEIAPDDYNITTHEPKASRKHAKAAKCRPHRVRTKVFHNRGRSWRYIRKWVRC